MKPRALTVSDPCVELILHMLTTLDDLGCDPCARIDARIWARHYRAWARALGIVSPTIAGRVP